MKGLMGDQPLTIRAIFDRMRTVYSDGEVVDATGRTTYGELSKRVLKQMRVLRDLGVEPGDRVATFANNSIAHLELYYSVPLLAAVLHMVNIRLYDEQVAYVIEHAGDTVAIVDDDLAEQFRASGALDAAMLERVLTMSELAALVDAAEPLALEELPPLDESAACGICYTSGTTGMPKGVVYSHRGTYLHAMAACMVDHLAIGEFERILPVVPLFHACGWGLPYVAPFTGAELVFVGADTSPANLARVISQEKVTFAAAVPTIWNALLPLIDSGEYDLSSLRTLGVGGAATPKPLMQAYDERGIEILQIWGMTETTPLACVSRPRRRHRSLDVDALREVRLKTGTIFSGLEMRITDEVGGELAWDGETAGEIEVRGPWVATAYYNDADLSIDRFNAGWLRTGDMAVMEPDGYFKIVDRAKDLVKSGGEWISSLDLEAAIMAHPQVLEAAVVGVRSQRWEERPVAFVVPHGAAPSLAELHAFLSDRVVKWWYPDDVVVVGEIPKTSVGKFDKKAMRAQMAEVVLP